MQYGRYRILSQLGEGGMASVYLAEDPALNRLVAVKVIHPHLSSDPGLLARFAQEARTIAALRSANIVEVFDCGIKDGRQFIVMEYMDGPALQLVCSMMKGKPIDQTVSVSFVCQAAEGLIAAEKKGVVHRDIKPENLIFNSEGYLKIADFGIAHLAGRQSRTATRAVLGTLNFMSPEQIEGQKPTIQADMWALGGVLFYCLTGKLPFAGSSLTSTMRNICHRQPAPLLDQIKDVDPGIIQLMQTLLQKEPANRGQGPGWLSGELRKFLNRAGAIDMQACARDFINGLNIPQKNTVVEPLPGNIQADKFPATGTGFDNGVPPGSSRKLQVSDTVKVNDSSVPGARERSATGFSAPAYKTPLVWIGGLLVLAILVLAGILWRSLPGNSDPAKSPVQNIILTPADLTLHPNEKKELTATILPQGADQSVDWSSSAPEVAAVSLGLVTGIKTGRSFISATSRVDPNKSAVARVTVKPEKKPEPEPAPVEKSKAEPKTKSKPRAVSTTSVPKGGPPEAVKQKAQKPGRLQINSSPPFATIRVNGKYWGETPMNEFREVPAGICRIEVVHKLYPPLDTVITINSGKESQYKFRLK